MWNAHCSRPFPRERPAIEYGRVDAFELVSLDSFISGYVSRLVGGEGLATADIRRLSDASAQLEAKVQELSGVTREYFASLAALAKAALASLPNQ